MTDTTSNVRVRFAPSPTGYLHIGGARTALFNWLYARHMGGKFLLRIEDTDLERSTEDSTQQILESMEWLGLTPDEPIEYQTRRADKHRDYLKQLLDSGAAYFCYCPKDRLEALREQAKARSKPFVYRRSLLEPGEMDKYKESGEAGVIRFAVPKGQTVLDDMVYSRIEFDNATIGDFVIARGDGSPLYNFTNAVDDIDMGITHICRGEDHVSNTPKQILVYQALGAHVPRFAHLPLILGKDKQRLSKRHGAVGVMQFRDDGILPDALVNFIALLGWAPEGGEFEEVMPIEDLIARFTLEKVNKSAAVFDYEKLQWMNGMYIRRMPKKKIYAEVVPQLKAAYGDGAAANEEWAKGIIDLEIERSRTMNDFAKNLDYFFVPPAEFEEKAAKKHLATPEHIQQLRNVATEIARAWPQDAKTRDDVANALDGHLRSWAEANGIKFGNAVHPVRLALTGRTASPPLFDVMFYLGKDETLRRIEAAAERFGKAETGYPRESVIEGTHGVLWFNYDRLNDTLFARLRSYRDKQTHGEEDINGFIVHRLEDTNTAVGFTVINWWKRFGDGNAPSSADEVSTHMEHLPSSLVCME